jgi:hypothetical protein
LALACPDFIEDLAPVLLTLFEVLARALSVRADLLAAGLDGFAFNLAALSRPFAFVSLFDLLCFGADLLAAGERRLVLTFAFLAMDLLACARLCVDRLPVFFWAFIVRPI